MYIDDNHARFEKEKQSQSFLQTLNKQNLAIKFAVEKGS